MEGQPTSTPSSSSSVPIRHHFLAYVFDDKPKEERVPVPYPVVQQIMPSLSSLFPSPVHSSPDLSSSLLVHPSVPSSSSSSSADESTGNLIPPNCVYDEQQLWQCTYSYVTPDTPSKLQTYPIVSRITDQIYIGSRHILQPLHMEWLMKENIARVLQCAYEMALEKEFPELQQQYVLTNQLEFRHIPMVEPSCTRKHHPGESTPSPISSSSENVGSTKLNIFGCNIPEMKQMKEMLEQAAEYIDHVVRIENKKIMVGCAFGMNRSVSSVLTYLMLYRNTPLLDALYYLKLHRPQIYPNLETFSVLLLIERDRIEKYHGIQPVITSKLFPVLDPMVITSPPPPSSSTTASLVNTTVSNSNNDSIDDDGEENTDGTEVSFSTDTNVSIPSTSLLTHHQLSITPEDLFTYHSWAYKALASHKIRNPNDTDSRSSSTNTGNNRANTKNTEGSKRKDSKKRI